MASIYKRISSNGESGGGSSSNVNVISSVLPFGAATAANQVSEINELDQIKQELTDSNITLLAIESALGTGDVNTVETGTVDQAFGDITSVPSGVLTDIVSYTAGGPTRVKFVEVSGTNIAQYTLYKNGVLFHKKQTFYGSLDNDFQFSKGYQLVASDILTVRVIHNQASLGEFSAFALVLKDY